MLRDTIVYVGTLDPAAEKLIQPVKAVSHRFTGHNLSPDWSPDGRQFAYFSSRGLSGMPGSIAICIHSFDTGKEREILPELRYIERLRWSHTGRALVVTGADNKGRKGIFEVDALSGALTPIAAAGEGIGDPVLSPDGRAIYYYSDGVVARDRETGREKQLLPRGRFMIKFLAPSWDGSKLAIVVQQSKKKSMSVYVMPSAGGEPLDILTLPENVSGMVLDWEPGGRNLIFAGANSTELWRVPAEGGKPEKLDIGMKNIGIRMLRLHPDGRQIAFSSYGAGKSEVWAMENFLPTLKASR
jgi:Tol biopolymer transport system component